MKKANEEGWNKLRKETTAKAVVKAQQKIANAMASNADKLEKAKGLAIDRIIRALEDMPDKGATNFKQYIAKDGKRQTVEYNLLELVTALEKMQKSEDSKPIEDAVQIIIDV